MFRLELNNNAEIKKKRDFVLKNNGKIIQKLHT